MIAPGSTRCMGCAITMRQLGAALVRVHPVHLAPPDGSLRRTLIAYKAAPSPFVREVASRRLAVELADFLGSLHRHLGTAGASVTAVATVPSTGAGRPSWHGTHPLDNVVSRAVHLVRLAGHGPLARVHLERGEGALGHLRASPDAYRLATVSDMPEASAGPVVVVDDLYTSGSHAQSAARALIDAGFTVGAIVPIGRLLRRDDPRDGGCGATPARCPAARSSAHAPAGQTRGAPAH
jgi:hypothetical protein